MENFPILRRVIYNPEFYYLILLHMKFRSQKTKVGEWEHMDFVALIVKIWFLPKGDFSYFSAENSILRHYIVNISPICWNDYLFSANRQFQNILWICCWMKIGSFRLNINGKSYAFFMSKNIKKIPNFIINL